MTEKRYYQKNYEEEYYIFDSNTLSEDDFEERVEYEGYDVFGDSLTGDEVIDLLNENEQLQFELKECNDNKLFSRRELEKENERIKHMIQEAYETERTAIGKNVLKQLLDCIEVME